MLHRVGAFTLLIGTVSFRWALIVYTFTKIWKRDCPSLNHFLLYNEFESTVKSGGLEANTTLRSLSCGILQTWPLPRVYQWYLFYTLSHLGCFCKCYSYMKTYVFRTIAGFISKTSWREYRIRGYTNNTRILFVNT